MRPNTKILVSLIRQRQQHERQFAHSAKQAHEEMKLPASRGLPFIGNLLRFLAAGGAPKLHHYIDAQHRRHGRIFQEKLGNVNAVFISDPELMRAVFANEGKYPVHVLPEAWSVHNQLHGSARGLFFQNGAEWLHNRRIMNNFLLKTLPGNRDFIRDAVECTARKFDVQKCEVDLEKTLYRWSLDTIVAVLLGRQNYEECVSAPLDMKLDTVSTQVKAIFETSAKLQFVPAMLAQKLRLKTWSDFTSAVNGALETGSDLVADLISLDAHRKRAEQNGGLLSLMAGKMSKSDIIKIVVDLVLAAGDTTAYTMQWALYLLAKNAQYQQAEGFTPIGIKNFVRETLRLYPVAPFITRINAEKDFTLDNVQIPRNTLLIYSLYTAGHDANIYAQAGDFRPERWMAKTQQMTQASLPFAMGARSCVGRRIAELQLQITLQSILTRYRIELINTENVEMVLKMISVPSTPIRLKFIPRDVKF